MKPDKAFWDELKKNVAILCEAIKRANQEAELIRLHKYLKSKK